MVRDFCGHGLGRLFHDEPNILHVGKRGEGAPLKPGMFFTIEPMINLGGAAVKVLSDGWTAVTRDRSLTAQFEHTVGGDGNGRRSLHAVAGGARSAAADLMSEAEAAHYHGHRERLRKRFLEAGDEALADYELIELILFRAIPRRDVKPLAKDLIEAFRLVRRSGRRARQPAHARSTGSAKAWRRNSRSSRRAPGASPRAWSKKRRALGSWSEVIDYCRTAMAFEDHEEFRVLFLDKKNGLIADEAQGVGTVDHTPVYPREVVKRALELAASAVILVHNHPSGDPTPSTQDVKMTLDIIAIAAPLGVTVHDHIIVGRQGHASLRGLRLI